MGWGMWEPENVARGTRRVQWQVCLQRPSPAGTMPPLGQTRCWRAPKMLCWEKPELWCSPPTLPIFHRPGPWSQPPAYPSWCHLASQISCQSELRLARKSTFLDAETVQPRQAARARGIPGHVGISAGPPGYMLESRLLGPWALPGGGSRGVAG